MAATELTWLESRPAVDADSEPSGWVAQINRVLGSDSTVWSESTTAGVKALQARAGLKPDGVVAGKTWALFMPDLAVGRPSHELIALRESHGLPAGHWFDSALATALGTERLDQAGWATLAGLTLEPLPVAEDEPPMVEVVDGLEEAPNGDLEVAEVAPRRKRATGAP